MTIPTEFVVLGLVVLFTSNILAVLLGLYLQYRSTKGIEVDPVVEYVTDPALVQTVQANSAALAEQGYSPFKVMIDGHLSMFWLKRGSGDDAYYAQLTDEGLIQYEEEPWTVIGFGAATLITSSQGYTYIPTKKVIIDPNNKSIVAEMYFPGFNAVQQQPVRRWVDNADPTLIM